MSEIQISMDFRHSITVRISDTYAKCLKSEPKIWFSDTGVAEIRTYKSLYFRHILYVLYRELKNKLVHTYMYRTPLKHSRDHYY